MKNKIKKIIKNISDKPDLSFFRRKKREFRQEGGDYFYFKKLGLNKFFKTIIVRVRNGGFRKRKVRKGRTPAGLTYSKRYISISKEKMAQQRVYKRYPNLEVLKSRKKYTDSKNTWFEVIVFSKVELFNKNSFKHFSLLNRKKECFK